MKVSLKFYKKKYQRIIRIKIKQAFEKIIFNTLSKLYNKFYKTDTKETCCMADFSFSLC